LFGVLPLTVNAFRHCFWSCTMAKYLGEAAAKAIADEHENAGNRDGQPKDEEMMDLANNGVGRPCGARGKGKNQTKNCWDACTDKYYQGALFGPGATPLQP
jgi:hypothetical protein